MDQCSCIIHYDFITTSDQLIKVSQASLKTLTESKEIRESLGQENHHEEQCNGIPEALGERSLFTMIGNTTKSLPLLKQY